MPFSGKLRVADPSAPVVAPLTLAPEAGVPLTPSNSSTCTVTLWPVVAVVGPLRRSTFDCEKFECANRTSSPCLTDWLQPPRSAYFQFR